jgi:hypothetical protein
LPPSSRSVLRASAGTDEGENFSIVGEALLLLLREDRHAVGEHVELALLAGEVGGLESVLPELGRETRGPSVVAASDGAVQDLDLHRKKPIFTASLRGDMRYLGPRGNACLEPSKGGK